MKLILPFFLLFSVARADEVSELALAFGGLQKVPSMDQSRIDFRFQERATFSFSKEKFTTRQAAQEFCASKNLSMAGAEHTLLLAMASSGLSQEINDAITFEVKGPSGEKAGGLMGWHNSAVTQEKDVFLMFNGQGTRSTSENFQTVREHLKIEGLPAICTDIDQEEQSAGVDDSDRSISPDEVEQSPVRSNTSGSRTSAQ